MTPRELQLLAGTCDSCKTNLDYCTCPILPDTLLRNHATCDVRRMHPITKPNTTYLFCVDHQVSAREQVATDTGWKVPA